MKHVTHWINGRTYVPTEDVPPTDRVDAALSAIRDKAVDLIDPERSGDIYDPATGKVSGTVDFASVRIMDEAVAAASAAFVEWGNTSITKRTQVMFAFRELLNTHKEDIAALITEEHGKVLSDALGEVTRGLEVVEFACGIPHLLKGGYSSGVSSSVDVYSIRKPLGVVGIISRSTSRRWSRCGSSPSRSPRATRSSSSPARRTPAPSTSSRSCGRKRVCLTACSTWCTVTRSRSMRS